MEAHAETILNNVAVARGRSAEYFGAGDGNANVITDTAVRTYGIPQRARNGCRKAARSNPAAGGLLRGRQRVCRRSFGDDRPAAATDLAAGAGRCDGQRALTIWFTFITAQDNIGGGMPGATGLLISHGGMAAWPRRTRPPATLIPRFERLGDCAVSQRHGQRHPDGQSASCRGVTTSRPAAWASTSGWK